MSEKPEALRLAEWIESDMTCQGDAEIAAELRRLHSANAELLEVMENIERSTHDAMTAALARAAIAKAEGQA